MGKGYLWDKRNDMEDGVICYDCEWTGIGTELISSEENQSKLGPSFDCCPDCKSKNLGELDDSQTNVDQYS